MLEARLLRLKNGGAPMQEICVNASIILPIFNMLGTNMEKILLNGKY